MQHYRVAPLQNLGVCDPGVGHVGVNPTPTLPPRPSPGPPSNGLIVCDVVIAKSEVVHATLQPKTVGKLDVGMRTDTE